MGVSGLVVVQVSQVSRSGQVHRCTCAQVNIKLPLPKVSEPSDLTDFKTPHFSTQVMHGAGGRGAL